MAKRIRARVEINGVVKWVAGATQQEAILAAAKRFIPIMDKSLLEIIPDGKPEEYVIGGDKPITETCYKRMWDRIEKTINMHGATAHVLRHTYATMAAGTGIDPKTLQSIMGHADIQTTMNRYAHRRIDKIEEAKETLKNMYL